MWNSAWDIANSVTEKALYSTEEAVSKAVTKGSHMVVDKAKSALHDTVEPILDEVDDYFVPEVLQPETRENEVHQALVEIAGVAGGVAGAVVGTEVGGKIGGQVGGVMGALAGEWAMWGAEEIVDFDMEHGMGKLLGMNQFQPKDPKIDETPTHTTKKNPVGIIGTIDEAPVAVHTSHRPGFNHSIHHDGPVSRVPIGMGVVPVNADISDVDRDEGYMGIPAYGNNQLPDFNPYHTGFSSLNLL